MPKMPSMSNPTPKEQIAEQVRNIPKEELRSILLQRILDFDTSLGNLYPKKTPGSALSEYNELHDRYAEAGGSASELAAATQAKAAAQQESERERVRSLIAAGKFPAVPPCPQYFKDDAGCGWENAWFDYHVRLTLQKGEQAISA